MAVVAGSTSSTQERLLENILSIQKARDVHKATAWWAVCSYDDRADEWADTQRRAAGQLLLVVNTSSATQPIGIKQRRAKLHHRKRLLEEAWRISPSGTDAFELIWFLDDDISFRGFDMAAYLYRWTCAFGENGPPVISQPTLYQGTQHGQVWPQSDDTYQLCLTGALGKKWGDDACFLRNTLALRNDWVEQWAPLLDAQFVRWWLDQNTTKRIVHQQLLLNSDFGADEIWCGAADEWVALHSPRTRVSCAVLTVPVVHDDTRTQQYKTGAMYKAGFRVLWKSGLMWPRSCIGKNCYARECCTGRNCTTHSWWRYTPSPGWTLPTSEEYVTRVRACAVTKLACPSRSLLQPQLEGGARAGDGMFGCGNLTDLWWDEHRDTYTGGI
jgi:hypothetical protein